MRGQVRRVLWGIDEVMVVVYLFVIAFGAVRPFEILPVTAAVAVLLVLWLIHELALRREPAAEQRDMLVS
jgi:hypothetical protein